MKSQTIAHLLTTTSLMALLASSPNSFGKDASQAKSKFFETSIKDLHEVIPSEDVFLKNGDRYEMTAAPAKQKINGKWIRRLAYNRMIPGPTFHAEQGSTAHVILKNDLSIDTTLHPHGLRGESKYDGIPGIGQPPIKPGANYDYLLTFNDIGMYWYHPHIRDDYAEDMGLYGAFIVRPKAPGLLKPIDREIPIVLDDVDLGKGGTAYRQDTTTHTLMGRYGSTYLVNGTVMPNINIDAGASVRFYVLNAANTRTFRFTIPGAALTLVGGDNGRFQSEVPVDAVSIGPGERYILEAKMPAKAGSLDIMNGKPNHPARMAKIILAAPSQSASPPPTLAPVLSASTLAPVFSEAELARFRAKASGPVDYSLRLNVAMDHKKLPMVMGKGHDHAADKTPAGALIFYQEGRTSGVEWDDGMAAMNRKSTEENVTWQMIDEADQKINMAINWPLKNRTLYLIRIKNSPDSMHPMQHPIHFHGQRFLVMTVNGKANPNLGWKDTALLGAGDVVDIVLETTHPGTWMAHCHILEHIGAGMMMGFTVAE